MQLSARGFSDFLPDRPFTTGTADEQRTGGEVRAIVASKAIKAAKDDRDKTAATIDKIASAIAALGNLTALL